MRFGWKLLLRSSSLLLAVRLFENAAGEGSDSVLGMDRLLLLSLGAVLLSLCGLLFCRIVEKGYVLKKYGETQIPEEDTPDAVLQVEHGSRVLLNASGEILRWKLNVRDPLAANWSFFAELSAGLKPWLKVSVEDGALCLETGSEHLDCAGITGEIAVLGYARALDGTIHRVSFRMDLDLIEAGLYAFFDGDELVVIQQKESTDKGYGLVRKVMEEEYIVASLREMKKIVLRHEPEVFCDYPEV